MSPHSRARLAWALLALYGALTAAGVVLGGVNSRWEDVGWFFVAAAFPVVGAVVAARGAGGLIGWVCLAVGLAVGVTAVSEGYGIYTLETAPGALAGGEYAVWFASFSWVFFVGPIALFILLFPDGRLPSPRWRPVPWLGAAAMTALATTTALSPDDDEYAVPIENPVEVDLGAVATVLFAVGIAGLFASMLAAVISIVVRYRRSRGEERLQMKWFTSAVALTALLFFAIIPAAAVSQTAESAVQLASVISWSALPLATGVAILRYRLYDIDVVINRAVLFTVLGAFITAVYVAIVVGVGAVIGTAGDPGLALSIVATAVVAVAFQPARERAQRLANRLVYGRRASPYEALAAISEESAAARAAEDVLPKVARAIAEGTGAARSAVWVKAGTELRLTASWPEVASDGPKVLELDHGQLPEIPSADHAVPVRHRGELLGALSVSKSRGEFLTAEETKLLDDVAAQAGLVLRNVGLTAELLARLDDLRASRQRLVSAQDEERRRLERNLHDGAQQHLVGLKVKLTLAARRAEDARLQEALAGLQRDVDEAIEALRDLARGIYPPLLAQEGLAAALDAHARKAPVDVQIAADGIGRYGQDVEAAVYFCCLEALQNVTKYAGASRAEVVMTEDGGQLRFIVRDDGAGFDQAATEHGSGLQNMVDRVEALGGTIAITSVPGRGTTVTGSIPFVRNGSEAPSRLEGRSLSGAV